MLEQAGRFALPRPTGLFGDGAGEEEDQPCRARDIATDAIRASSAAWAAVVARKSGRQPSSKPSPNRNKALAAGAGVLAVVAIGGVVIAPKLLAGGSRDHGQRPERRLNHGRQRLLTSPGRVSGRVRGSPF